jgi:hypothetical protein
LLPVLLRHHFPCRVGTFVLVALALLPSSSLHCRQHCELASAQAQGSCNMRWCHCQHRALVVANVAPASSLLLRGCLCPRRAGVATLSTPALPPASQTGICPVMTQLRPVVGEVSLSHSTLLPVASLLYPESAHSDFGLQQSGQGSNGIFVGVALVSSRALHWRHCQRQAVLVAGVAPALLPSWPSRSGRCRTSVCQRCACVLPASRWRHCQHCAVVHVTGVVPASSPCCVGAFALVTPASLSLSPLPCLQHCDLASAQSRNSHNMCWHHCQHRAIIVAGVAPALSPLSHGRFCPCSAGVTNLGIPALRQHHELASSQS